MPIFDDPGKAMRNIEQELLDEQARETAESGEEGANYAVDFDRTAYADEETDEACFVEDTGKKPKWSWRCWLPRSGGGFDGGAEARRAVRTHPLRADAPGQRVRGADGLAVRPLPGWGNGSADGGSGHPADKPGICRNSAGRFILAGTDL